MDIYFYLAVAGIIIIISWRMVSGFRKGMVQEILSLIAMVVAGFCAYLLLGAGTAQEDSRYGKPMHNPQVVFNEDILPRGAALHTLTALRFLERT